MLFFVELYNATEAQLALLLHEGLLCSVILAGVFVRCCCIVCVYVDLLDRVP